MLNRFDSCLNLSDSRNASLRLSPFRIGFFMPRYHSTSHWRVLLYATDDFLDNIVETIRRIMQVCGVDNVYAVDDTVAHAPDALELPYVRHKVLHHFRCWHHASSLIGTRIHVPHDALQPSPFGEEVADGSVEFCS